ncbi:MAG TPA: SgcJ/EcaC family oxidoreductase [Longimicrobiales bacterium]|nr:SgcJ/EcaC family oxidoreductase [Longimicrobiales bacterium]
MRRRLLCTTLVCLLATPAFAQENPPPGSSSTLPEYEVFGEPASPEDAAAIMALMRRFSQARAAGDAEATAAAFADDVEWTNAFGDVVRGSDNLQTFLAWLFARDVEMTTAREVMEYRPVSLRYLGEDVAIVHGMTLSTRGEARSGEGPRRVHLTFVLARQGGEWKIVYQMIMDARD